MVDLFVRLLVEERCCHSTGEKIDDNGTKEMTALEVKVDNE